MSKIETFTAVRIIPRESDFLNRRVGNLGEIFYDREFDTLRLFDSTVKGGLSLARADFSNIAVDTFRDKIVESNVSTVVYNVTVTGPDPDDSTLSNKYNLNAIYNPEPNFVVGYTYIFVQDDLTNVYFPNGNNTTPNPHPLNFSADNINGELDGGTSYTTNVKYFLDSNEVTQAVYNSEAFNTATSRQVRILVTNSTPAILYYWCSNHQNMGNSIAVADPGIGEGGSRVTVSEENPEDPENGNLWLDMTTGYLYVYINDGDTEQWIQPAFPTFSGSYNDLTDLPVLSKVSETGSYEDILNTPSIPEKVSELDNDRAFLTEVPESISSSVFSTDSTLLVDADQGLINTHTLSQVSASDSQALVWNDGNSRWQPGLINAVNNLTVSGDITISGTTILQQTVEKMATLADPSATSNIDFEQGSVWFLYGMTTDFTVNFTNVPSSIDSAITIVLLLNQGATAYLPNQVQIDGATQTIQWQDGIEPSPNNESTDVISFTLINTGSTWEVLGSITTYSS